MTPNGIGLGWNTRLKIKNDSDGFMSWIATTIHHKQTAEKICDSKELVGIMQDQMMTITLLVRYRLMEVAASLHLWMKRMNQAKKCGQ